MSDINSPNRQSSVRLDIQFDNGFVSISCEICHSIIFKGRPSQIGVDLRNVCVAAITNHVHENGSGKVLML